MTLVEGETVDVTVDVLETVDVLVVADVVEEEVLVDVVASRNIILKSNSSFYYCNYNLLVHDAMAGFTQAF